MGKIKRSPGPTEKRWRGAVVQRSLDHSLAHLCLPCHALIGLEKKGEQSRKSGGGDPEFRCAASRFTVAVGSEIGFMNGANDTYSERFFKFLTITISHFLVDVPCLFFIGFFFALSH